MYNDSVSEIEGDVKEGVIEMSDSMLKEKVEFISKKYAMSGVVLDYNVVTKLFFTYEGKDIEMAIHKNFLKNETLEEVGSRTIDSYIDNLSNNEKDRKLQLHYWYIEELGDDEEKYMIGHGIVTGHTRMPDALDIHTSKIMSLTVEEKAGELIIFTQNSVYHCPLEYCSFNKQDNFPDIIPDYENLKEKYKDKIEYPSIEPGKVLIVLSNFCKYYFHSVYYIPKDAKNQEPLKFTGHPHIGTFQDSYLIEDENWEIDLRYFPHFQNIEFYAERTEGNPLYLENIGDVVLYAKTHCGSIKLNPGERKEVCKENAESETPCLPGGDLYPAGIIE